MSTSQKAVAVMAQQQLGALPANIAAILAQAGGKLNDELGSGITSGFAVVSVRGKVFRIKHRGEERDITNDDGDPRASIEVIIVKASPHIAKIFYEQGYVEGSNSPPDCWSVDGRVPDAASPKRQSPTCAGCPQNAWGSRVTPAGNKGKACADSKRLAVVPMQDIDNEFFGGPMLMRVPPASLSELKTYSDKLNQMGYPAYAVATRIRLDPKAEYPRLTFGAIRALTEEEAAKVLDMRESDVVERILVTAVDHVEADVAATVTPESMFEQPPVNVPANQTVKAKPAQVPQKPPAGVPPVAKPKPVQAGPVATPGPMDGIDPDTGEVLGDTGVPANPNPVAASKARAAQVEEQIEETAPSNPFAPKAPKANGANGAAKPAAAAPKKAAAPTPPPAAVEEEEGGEAPVDFENMLDNMLGD